jgi:GT2 family glycosyltransferase
MVTKIPVAGVVWQTMHYLIGLRRLGFDPYYVEAHARTPSMLMASVSADAPGARDMGVTKAAAFLDRIMRRFDLRDKWAYHALHAGGTLHGPCAERLPQLYDAAELIVNLHGGTAPREEQSRTGRLVYVETDPVQLQFELAAGDARTVEFLEQHCAFFTFGENWGAEDCGLPRSSRFHFRPTRQPVCLELWPVRGETPAPRFTTIGNWRQRWRDVEVDGVRYSWSKDLEFGKVLSLPARTRRRFELSLGGCTQTDEQRLRAAGWDVRDAAPLSWDVDRYRSYVSSSFAEFTVAKEQNVVFRSGWFSDRSATYLAAGRPVVTQETGFSNVLPTGAGLYGFRTLDEAAAAVEAVCADYPAARRAAREVAREYFSSDVVLRDLLATVGVSGPSLPSPRRALSGDLVLAPRSRRPLRLEPATESALTVAPVPFGPQRPWGREASVVVVSHDHDHVTRMCLESVLEHTDDIAFELVVVDNASRDTSRSYLRTMARRFPNVRLVLNAENAGFPAACNQALRLARGDLLVLLNNDVIVAPQWLSRLRAHAADPGVGLVGPVTNRIGNEAEVAVDYRTYREFLIAAATRASEQDGRRRPIAMPAMFCLAMRRDVYERLGPLDESFGPGTLEDDDYAERAREAGLASVCAEDVLVHHFGEASFGRLFADGSHSALLERNRRRFESKWGRPWQPYGRRESGEYRAVRERVRALVEQHAGADEPVVVVTRGDEELLRLAGREGWHFPEGGEGVYAGHHPADDREAIRELERLRARGAAYFVLPKPSFWWLHHYRDLDRHLAGRYREIVRDDACRIFDLRVTG